MVEDLNKFKWESVLVFKLCELLDSRKKKHQSAPMAAECISHSTFVCFTLSNVVYIQS